MMKTATSTREIAALGAASTRPKTPARPPLAGGVRRKLRIVELRDGRAHLVEAGGTLFMPCSSTAVAARMQAVFST
jgi:hypothetical protein